MMNGNKRRSMLPPSSFAPPEILVNTTLRFSDCFWNPSRPHDYRAPYAKILGKLLQGSAELAESLSFFREFASIQEENARRLVALAAPKLFSDSFGRDEGASLRKTYEQIRGEVTQLGRHEKQLAENIHMMVIRPLQKFSEEHRKVLGMVQSEVDTQLRQFESFFDQYQEAKILYEMKCRDADKAEADAKTAAEARGQAPGDAPAPGSILARLTAQRVERVTIFGPLSFTEVDLEEFLHRMYEQIPQQEFRTLLSTFTGVSGGDIADWLQVMYSEVIPDVDVAEECAQAMLDAGYIAPIGRDRKFQAFHDMLYKWTDLFLNTCEPSHKRLRQEAEDADLAYRIAVKNAESSRMLVEQALMTFLNTMHQVEHDRITAIKTAFESMAVTMSNNISFSQAQYDRLMTQSEQLNPDEDVQALMEQYRTGIYTPKPIVYENFYRQAGKPDQLFGEPLDKLPIGKESKVNQFIAKVISCIDKASFEMEVEDRRLMWAAPLDLPAAHALRCEINRGEKVRMRQLRKYDVSVMVAVLRLFLIELPDCILTSALYEPVKKIYEGYTGEEGVDERIASVRTLLSDVPTINFYTLEIILEHINQLVSELDYDDVYVTELCQVLAPVFFRPIAFHPRHYLDTHPAQLMQDLIYHFDVAYAPMHRLSSVSIGKFGSEKSVHSEDDMDLDDDAEEELPGVDVDEVWGRFIDDPDALDAIWDSPSESEGELSDNGLQNGVGKKHSKYGTGLSERSVSDFSDFEDEEVKLKRSFAEALRNEDEYGSYANGRYDY